MRRQTGEADRLEKPKIKPVTRGKQGEKLIHYNAAASIITGTT